MKKERKSLYLTRAEEQVMQILWDLEEGLVKDVREKFPEPRPARNTISTVIRVLEKKGFVDHKDYGSVYVYYPVVSREEYSKSQLYSLMENYFNNSFPALASFFAKEKYFTISELDAMLKELKNEMKNNSNDNE